MNLTKKIGNLTMPKLGNRNQKFFIFNQKNLEGGLGKNFGEGPAEKTSGIEKMYQQIGFWLKKP